VLWRHYHTHLRNCKTGRTPPNEYCFARQIFTPDSLLDLIAQSDYIVAALPHTPATHKLISAEAIAAMRPHTVFVNVGRGKTVDEEALIEGEGVD
jgi:phosphoglycerate dehydrogenase-like enzyme